MSFAKPAELSETSLSSSLSLLKTSASLKSSNSSLRKRRLAEIAEESKETGDQDSTTDQSTVKADGESGKGFSTVAGSNNNIEIFPEPIPKVQTGYSDLSKSVEESSWPGGSSESRPNLEEKPPLVTSTRTSDEEIPAQRPFDNSIWDGRPSFDRRQSSQSARPSAQDLYDEDHIYSPKIKVGPRPSLDYSRARSSGSVTRSNGPRPVATMPAGVHVPARKPASTRPQSQHTFSPPKFLDALTMQRQLPLMAKQSFGALDRPTSKAGSIASVSTFAYVSEPKFATTTPEKQRLMKALQLRKKQLEKNTAEVVTSETPEKSIPQQIPEQPATAATFEAADCNADRDNIATEVAYVNAKGPRDAPPAPDLSTLPIVLRELSEETPTKASSLMESEESTIYSTVSNHVRGPNETDISEDGELFFGHRLQTEVTQLQGDQKHVVPKISSVSTHQSDLPGPEIVPNLGTPNSSEIVHEMFLPSEVPLPIVDEDERSLLQASPASTVHVSEVQNSAPVIILPNKTSRTRPHSSIKKSGNDAGVNKSTRPSTADSVDLNQKERNVKRRGLVDPLKIGLSGEQSDDNFLSDDSFMDELQSATVHEAKPISVSRSPVTSVFPTSPKMSRSSSAFRLTRTISNPLDSGSPEKGGLLTPELSSSSLMSQNDIRRPETAASPRSVSSPLDNGNAQAQRHLSPSSSTHSIHRSISVSPTARDPFDNSSPVMPKKSGVSSLISQRIKALEKISSPSPPGPLSTPTATPVLVGKRKDSLSQSQALSTPSSIQMDGTRWRNRKDVPYPTPSPSPQNVLSRSFEAKTPRSQPESISVTATIVRDSGNRKPEIPLDPSEPVQQNFHHSPLVVQQHATGHALSKTFKKSSKSKSSSEKSDSSAGQEVKRPIATRRDSAASKKSSSSRKESVDTPRSLSRNSSDGLSNDGLKEEKKESRKTRLFKRMSAISSSSRRGIAQALGPSMKEEPIVERQEPEARLPSANIDLGDVNVQFPDTLVGEIQLSQKTLTDCVQLWKRRHMTIDNKGFLVLSPSEADPVSFHTPPTKQCFILY